MTTIAPVHREVLVSTDIATAFELFTAHVGAWWPLRSHGVFGGGSSVAFEDVDGSRRLVERSGADASVWAEVLEWEPPHRLRLNWHPGSDPAEATDLTVTFSARDGQVLVALDHAGWERRADGERAAGDYSSGWGVVLGRYGQWFSGV
jgi:uncharacterized protein YndB with AHSA1/START domain